MRPLYLIPMLLFPLSACMTQRDQTVWQEFKAEISSDAPAESKAEAQDADAASEAVTPPAAVDKE
ncbi:MAG TPA: hypothetical protein VFO10_17095 [Oligoflexus sp.]|uniref:hypothetical protein n=1 Tax=Oligoflexus sp. TaxID=1971216 RepID=UPI002D80E129|nr:hypothetical protein [Oligoflexus sp.]HET9238978.1 hypothetical protein [Oligoflexus sp.]